MRLHIDDRAAAAALEMFKYSLTTLYDLIVNRFAISVENPGAKQLWAMKPSLSSAKQTALSPLFQSQLGMLSKYDCSSNASHTFHFCIRFLSRNQLFFAA